MDDLPNVNEDVANEIVNDIVCEDPSFGSVLIDGDINEILNVEPDGYGVILKEGLETYPDDQIDTPTRRKQRIVPKTSEPFELNLYGPEITIQQNNSRYQKRPYGFSDVDHPNNKKSRTVSVTHQYLQDERQQSKNDLHVQFLKSEPDLGNLRPVSSDNDKPNNTARQRKRGLTQDERKERKKQSNRNASYRYRQRKKDEIDGFYQNSLDTLQTFENEKEAYQNVVEEFIRCIKHAQLVSDARCERKNGLLLKV